MTVAALTDLGYVRVVDLMLSWHSVQRRSDVVDDEVLGNGAVGCGATDANVRFGFLLRGSTPL